MLPCGPLPILQVASAPTGAQATSWRSGVPKAPPLRRGHVGLIRRWGLDYLRVDYYADPLALGRRSPQAQVLETLLQGHVWCGYQLTLQEGISAARRRETLLDQFRRHWPGPFDPNRPSVRHFLEAVNSALDPGDAMAYLFDPAGVLHFRRGQGPWQSISDPELTQAFRHLAYVGDPDNQSAIAALRASMERAFPIPPPRQRR